MCGGVLFWFFFSNATFNQQKPADKLSLVGGDLWGMGYIYYLVGHKLCYNFRYWPAPSSGTMRAGSSVCHL